MASSMSSAVERATWHRTLPETGLILSKYWPRTGATHLPPMKLSNFDLIRFFPERLETASWYIDLPP